MNGQTNNHFMIHRIMSNDESSLGVGEIEWKKFTLFMYINA